MPVHAGNFAPLCGVRFDAGGGSQKPFTDGWHAWCLMWVAQTAGLSRGVHWGGAAMSASRILRVSVLALLLIPASSVGAQLMARATSDPEYIVVSRFRAAVETYVVRHHVFEPLSPELMCLPEDTVAAVNALAEVPREAWPAPREGEISAWPSPSR